MDYRNSENWEGLWDNIESGDLLTESKKIEKKTTTLNESAKCPRPRKQRIVEETENKDCKDGKCDKCDELYDAEKKRFSKAAKVAKPEKNLDECGDNLEEKKCCGEDCKDDLNECGDNFEKELSEAFMAGYKAALKEGKTK